MTGTLCTSSGSPVHCKSQVSGLPSLPPSACRWSSSAPLDSNLVVSPLPPPPPRPQQGMSCPLSERWGSQLDWPPPMLCSTGQRWYHHRNPFQLVSKYGFLFLLLVSQIMASFSSCLKNRIILVCFGEFFLAPPPRPFLGLSLVARMFWPRLHRAALFLLQ